VPAARVPRLRAELLGFLLAPAAAVEPSPLSPSPPPAVAADEGGAGEGGEGGEGGRGVWGERHWAGNRSDASADAGLERRRLAFRRRWRGCDVAGEAGLAGVLWDATGLPAIGDVAAGDVSRRRRLPQRLAFLLGVETAATLAVLSEALAEWDATESECLAAAGVVPDGPGGGAGEDRMVSQAVVDCAIAAAEAFHDATLAKAHDLKGGEGGGPEGCGRGCEGAVVRAAATARARLLYFVAELVGGGRATLAGVSRVNPNYK